MRRPVLSTAVALGLALAATGCGDPEETLAPPDAVYTARGEVVATPAPGNRSLLVRHESIPDFRSRSGELEGMDSMTMPFTVGRDLSLEGLEEGDPVEFDFEVRWESDPILRIARLEELPADAALDFRPLPREAEPAAGDAAPADPPAGTSPHEAPEGVADSEPDAEEPPAS